MKFYKRNLPHYHTESGMFFITFTLDSAIPVEDFYRMRVKYDKSIKRLDSNSADYKVKKYIEQKRHFARIDKFLNKSDTCTSYLSNADIASIISKTIEKYTTDDCELISYTIMPNHVHMLVDIEDNEIANDYYKSRLSKILQHIKGNSALLCNRYLQRQGSFWSHESYDHFVRNRKEMIKILWYILQDPVRAGFVCDWWQWGWTYSIYNPK